VLIGESSIGALMELAPRTAEALDLPRRVVVCELDVPGLFAGIAESTAEAPPRYPGIARDIALVVPAATRIGDVEDVIRQAAGERLALLYLFDTYRGEQVPEGTMSLAFSLSLRDPERTLTDDDADAVMVAIARAAATAGWTIRA